MKDTWTLHGTSIVSDGWTNVVASNSSGFMFMYVKDFTRWEKTWANITGFLLESTEEVGSSNVLQVIIGDATNSIDHDSRPRYPFDDFCRMEERVTKLGTTTVHAVSLPAITVTHCLTIITCKIEAWEM
ncbi:hypothetical protein V6N13_015073 [Hibiscus sabdariffa]|uniref:Uncharacterized protein n=1 Tax=Hibiscus sabdariffa TaxID=183260 RepID=A0ABR2RY21_9ROSI